MIPRWKDLSEEYNGQCEFHSNCQEIFPKQCRLGPENDFRSSGPEKIPKIVNCATIKETEKLKETMVRVQVE